MIRGKHAVVTGGSRGIGFGIASLLAQRGARVSIVSRSPAGRQYAADGLFRTRGDVAVEDQVAAALTACRGENGRIDILVNNAGVAESAPLKRTSSAMWERIIATNLNGTFLCTRAVIGEMLDARWGRILNVASIAGLHGAAYVSAYCASKHGVVGFTRAIAAEIEGTGVTINALCPGYTETAMVHAAVTNIAKRTGGDEQSARAQLAQTNPDGRIASVEEVAHAAVALIEGTQHGVALVIPGGEIA